MRRPAYCGLKSGVPNPLVCGRKFCSRCGRWRHGCDFDWMKTNGRPDRLRAWCRACQRIHNRETRIARTEEQKELIREYQRIWSDAKRREAGVPTRNFKYDGERKNGDGTPRRRRTKIDRPERVFLDPAPLLKEMNRHYEEIVREYGIEYGEQWSGIDAYFAYHTGVQERQLSRYRTGESQHVRIDVADKIANVMHTTVTLLYDTEPAITL